MVGKPSSGYIADDGTGIDPAQPVITVSRLPDGVWEGMAAAPFATFLSLPYMYRFNNAQHRTVYRTDIFSRSQIGKGDMNPATTPWPGTPETLNGHVSCSVVIDADVIRREFASTPPGRDPDLIPVEEFWATEFTPGLPVPTRLEDLVIYELHVGSLGFGKPGAGDLSDAVQFIDHLRQLGVNAVELLPLAEFGGTLGWGSSQETGPPSRSTLHLDRGQRSECIFDLAGIMKVDGAQLHFDRSHGLDCGKLTDTRYHGGIPQDCDPRYAGSNAESS